MSQKDLAPIVIVILIALTLGGYLFYANYSNNQTNLTSPFPQPPPVQTLPTPTPTPITNYCDLPPKGHVLEVKDCGNFKVVNNGCCDIPDTIYDKGGNLIMKCGGLKGYSGECEKQFLPQTNCIVTECKRY